MYKITYSENFVKKKKIKFPFKFPFLLLIKSQKKQKTKKKLMDGNIFYAKILSTQNL